MPLTVYTYINSWPLFLCNLEESRFESVICHSSISNSPSCLKLFLGSRSKSFVDSPSLENVHLLERDKLRGINEYYSFYLGRHYFSLLKSFTVIHSEELYPCFLFLSFHSIMSVFYSFLSEGSSVLITLYFLLCYS